MYSAPRADPARPTAGPEKKPSWWFPGAVGQEGQVKWALVYASLLVGWAIYDWLANPADASGGRRLHSFLALLVLALVAGFVEVRSLRSKAVQTDRR